MIVVSFVSLLLFVVLTAPSLDSRLPHGRPTAHGGPIAKGTFAPGLDYALKYTVNTAMWGNASSLDDMIKKSLPVKDWRPDPSSEQQEGTDSLMQATGCDVLTVPFNPQSDAACVKYLTDTSNWIELVPLAMRYDARTIKYQVRFADPRLHSILKVPQKLFPNEAFSEVAAYHADRVLQLHRIPPTGWVCIPIATIKNATATFASSVETEDEFLKESNVASYSEWIEHDLLEYAKSAHLIAMHATVPGGCIGASIQLHVADVHHLLDSPLKIPYKAHNSSWHRYYDLTTEDPAHPLTRFIKQKWAPTIVHISELITFDYIAANGDRSPNKNNFIVGKCNRDRDVCDEDTDQFRARWIHPGPPSYIHLDQGMSFYERPKGSPLTKAFKRGNSTFCIFRRPLVIRLAELAAAGKGGGCGFECLMDERLPRKVKAFVTKHSLKKAQRRVEEVLEVVDRCRKEPFGLAVIAP